MKYDKTTIGDNLLPSLMDSLRTAPTKHSTSVLSVVKYDETRNETPGPQTTFDFSIYLAPSLKSFIRKSYRIPLNLKGIECENHLAFLSNRLLIAKSSPNEILEELFSVNIAMHQGALDVMRGLPNVPASQLFSNK
jgi:hypothetical protein